MFEVRFTTTTHAPPHRVSILTPLNEWENIEGSYADGTWTFSLDETELWTEPGYFKFILDERFWMDDPYIRIAPAPGDAYNFDETTVTFAMSTTAPTTATPAQASSPMPTPEPTPVVPGTPPPAVVVPPISEGAVINRVVILSTPFITAGAAWVAGVIARHVPGVKLDQTQVVSFMIAIVVVCLAGAWKWLQGWQQHELLVAQRLAAPIKAVISTVQTGPPA
ncbi:MAG: hypothetical protein E6G08_00435 [Actinobacteria bacterium]|nr:MAG: hypothetical protein E6G08_00435 [Actinomycetota bacterium]